MGANNLAILAIGDNRDSLESLKALAPDALPGARIRTASNVQKGIELALADDPDVILLDIAAPETDGFELCRRLKADERLQHIPVVFLTGLETPREIRVGALEAGADGFLSKPLDKAELTAQVRAMARIKAAAGAERREKGRLASLVLGRTRELERELAERKQAEEALRVVAESGFAFGEDIFRFLVRQLAVSQGKRHAVLARIDEGDLSAAHTVAVWSDGAFAANFSYALEGTPCGNVLEHGPCLYPRHLRKLFPSDPLLDPLEAESYWGTPLRDIGGNLVGLLALIDDRPMEANPHTLSLLSSFAARAAAEIARQRTEEKYSALFNQTTDGFAVHEIVCHPTGTPVDYRFLAVNPAFERMTGLRAADLAGKRVLEVMPHLEPGWIERYGRVALSGEPIRFESYTAELGKWFEVNAFRPQPGQFACVFQDITGRKRTQEALRESEVRFKAIAGYTANWESWFGPDGKLVWVNPSVERFTGYSPEEILAMPDLFSIVIAEEDRDMIRERLRGAFEGSRGDDLEFRYLRKDGTKSWLSVSWQPLLDEAGHFAGVRTSGRDIADRKRMEEDLRQSERRYRALFGSMMEGFAYCKMLYDPQGRPVDFIYLDVNDAFEQLTGLRDVVGKRVSEAIPGILDASPELFERYDQVASTGKSGKFEFSFSPLGVWLNVCVYSSEKGYFAVIFEDITERKQHETDRETTLTLLRLLNSPNDTRELIRTVGGLLQEWSGCAAVGIRLREGEDFPYYDTRGFPPEFVEAENYLCARGGGGEPLRDGAGNVVLECMCGNVLCGRFNPNLPCFTPQGSFWTNSTTALLASTSEEDRLARTRNRCNGEGYESVALIPLRGSTGTLGLVQLNDLRPGRFTAGRIAFLERAAGSIAIALEQRKTQAALQASEARYRLISENTSDVIWVLDVDSKRFTYVSPSVRKLRGYSPEENLAQSLEEVLTPESFRYALRVFEETLARREAGDKLGGEDLHLVDQVRRDGSIVRTEVVTTFLPDAHGRIRQVLGVTRDITERLKVEARLMQAQKMESVGRLAGGVAHDFNNLLTVINGYSKMSLDRLAAADPLREDLEEILKAGERAAALTQQLLAFSRKQVLQPRLLDLNRVVGGMQSMLRRLLAEDVKVRIELGPDTGNTCADPHQLEQALMNLVVNSRDAMPGGGTLTIETARADVDAVYALSCPEARVGRYAVLAVSDTGMGMDEETRRHIFEPFFTTKELGKGTGLGLSMIQGIVEQSGGFIEVSSALGRGTTFRIYLPSVETAADAVTPEAGPAPRGRETVLVVEDQAEVRKYVVAALGAFGYRVIGVENGGEALRLCERERGRIDLVLTDVVMPNLSGRELASRLELLQPAIKVLFMSGHTDDAMVHHGVVDSGVMFIQKPFSPDQLAVKVRETLGTGGRPARILVVDDEAAVRGFLRAALEEGGYEVTEAANGKLALAEARQGRVDLVVTDLVMPEQEGIETIQALRREVPGLGIIAMSGAFGGQLLKAAQILGADAAMSKPVSAGHLLAKVAEVLQSRR